MVHLAPPPAGRFIPTPIAKMIVFSRSFQGLCLIASAAMMAGCGGETPDTNRPADSAGRPDNSSHAPDVPDSEPAPDQLALLRQSLHTGDTQAMFAATRAIYQSFNFRISTPLFLTAQDWHVPLSCYDDFHNRIVTSQLLQKGEGREYWQTWSDNVAGGTWDLDAAFSDEADMRLTGNYAILGLLAHEFGHHIHYRYRIKMNRGDEELFADKCAVAFMIYVSADAELAKLRQRYIDAVVNSLRMAIPEAERVTIPADANLDTWCHEFALPEPVASYVSLALARQARLFAADQPPPLADVERKVASPTLAAVLETRQLVTPPWRMETATTAGFGNWGDIGSGKEFSVSPDGTAWMASVSDDLSRLEMTCADITGNTVRVSASGSAVAADCSIAGVAVRDASTVFVATFGGQPRIRVYELSIVGSSIDAKLIGQLDIAVGRVFSIGLSPDGSVWIYTWLRQTAESKIEHVFLRVDGPGGTLTAQTALPKNRGATFSDGESANCCLPGGIEPFSVDDHGAVYFLDTERNALRRIRDGRVETVAGGIRDGNDGDDSMGGNFMNPMALGMAADGRIHVLDRWELPDGEKTATSWRLRTLTPGE